MVHAHKGEAVPEALPVQAGLAEDDPGVEHAHPDGVQPARKGLWRPVGGLHILQAAGALHELGVVGDGDEVRVRPFRIQKVKHATLLTRRRKKKKERISIISFT